MKNTVNIEDYIQDFNYEIMDKNMWINIHLNLMFNELVDIQQAVYIFNIVNNEWNRRADNKEKINYSEIRTILFESLPYKIFIGLNKILSSDSGYSLQKTINVISQMDEYKNKISVKHSINEINTFLMDSKMLSIVTTCRDKFYAHLDKKCVLSDFRIDVSIPMKEIEYNEITKAILLIRKLYETCFEVKLSKPITKLNPYDIIYTFFWMTDNPEKL